MFLTAHAFCPVCTVAVGAGVGLSRWLGIDDTITGVWVGGLTISLIVWNLDWLKNKTYNNTYTRLLVIVLWLALMLVPLWYYEIVGHPFNTLWGVDKLLLGMMIGALVFIMSGLWYKRVLKNNGGKPHFPFQKVVMPVIAMIVTSGIFYLISLK